MAVQSGHVLPHIPKGVWIPGLVSMLMDISSGMIHGILPLFMLTALGMSAFAAGAGEGLAEATALIARIFSGTLSDYIGRRKGVAVFGYALSAPGKPFFALTTLGWVALGARLADRAGKGIRGMPRDALVADLSPPELRGPLLGCGSRWTRSELFWGL